MIRYLWRGDFDLPPSPFLSCFPLSLAALLSHRSGNRTACIRVYESILSTLPAISLWDVRNCREIEADYCGRPLFGVGLGWTPPCHESFATARGMGRFPSYQWSNGMKFHSIRNALDKPPKLIGDVKSIFPSLGKYCS